MKLRLYQKNAVDAVFRYFSQGGKGHPLICAPTGSGKSHILAGFCAEVNNKYPEQSILIITHTKEIILQDYAKLCEYLPPEKVGKYSTGLRSYDIRQFTVASIQTIYKKPLLFKHFNFIIVDEAHLIPPEGEGRYRTFFEAMPKVPILGLTATPFRRAHGLLTEDHIFDRIIYDIEIQYLIDAGFLAPLRAKETSHTFNVKNLPVLAGDYSKADLSRRFDRDDVTGKIIEYLQAYKDKRKHWLVFAIDIEHCEHIAEALMQVGIPAAAVHSKLPIDRAELLDLFMSGALQALVAVETLTTGFDAPMVDMIAMLRPTASPVLHVQMLGRGMRTAENKKDCLVLDFAGNTQRLGPVDAVQIPKKRKKGDKKGKSEGFTRTCPKCSEICHISRKECTACGYVFPVKAALSQAPVGAAVLKAQNKPVEVKVSAIRYSKHHKVGKPPSLKVSYMCGLLVYNEWIAFEHQGYPKHRAEVWWRNRTDKPVPVTVEEALGNTQLLKEPTHIRVDQLGQYPQIVGYKWD